MDFGKITALEQRLDFPVYRRDPIMRRFLPLLLLFGMPCVYAADQPAVPAEEVPLSTAHARVYRENEPDSPNGPIVLAIGPHLFLDNYLIASSTGITRVVNVPMRDTAIPNPVVTGKEDGCFQPYMTIFRDPETGRFRIWYGSRVETQSESTSCIGYMESPDGVHWERPYRVLPDPGPIQFGSSVVDDGPACPDPSKRYKFAWWYGGGLRIATSPDGFTFTPVSQDPVIVHNHDITGLSYDTPRARYVATVSVYRGSDAWEGNRRITMHGFSTDLLHWTEPHYVLVPDYSIDEGELQFYAMDGYLQRGDLTVAMVKVLRDDLKADTPPDPPEAYGVGYTTLAWSRDGETWIRDPEPFFQPDPRKGAWDHAHAWIDEQLPVGDEVYLYYGGYARGHKVNRFEERQIGLIKMKQDRYVARAALEGTGELVTPPLLLDGTTLAVNACAKQGSLRLEIRDDAGVAIPGFTFSACALVTTDAVREQIRWAHPLRELYGKRIQLAFRLERASLYALYLE